jgi:hypothetical protein
VRTSGGSDEGMKKKKRLTKMAIIPWVCYVKSENS